jgi:signal transduction histidine kinase
MNFAMIITRVNFLHAKIAVKRSVVYALLIATIALLFFGIEFIIEKFIYHNDEVVDIVAAVSGAFLFSKIQTSFENLTDNIFFRGQYSYTEAIKNLNTLLGKTIDLEELLELIANFFMATVKPDKVVFVFTDNDKAIIFTNQSTSFNKQVSKNTYAALVKQYNVAVPRIILLDRPKDATGQERSIFAAADNAGIAAIVPLFSNDHLIALMLIGKKMSGNSFLTQDHNLFAVVSHQAGMAIENARLYDALQRHSEELERRVKEKTQRIKQMYAEQSKFLANITHEFQTPIAILKGNLAVVAKKNTSGRANAIYVMTTTLDRLSRLVVDLLDVAKLNFSKEKLSRQAIDVKKLLRNAHDDCAILAEDKGIVLSVVSDVIFVSGDKDKLKEVILNLVSNALKHTPAGGEITLSARRFKGSAEIAITDTGKGIPAENLSRVFDRFYQINQRGMEQGAGIGLHLCRQIIEAHNGTITAESTPGVGSRFVMHLPLLSSFFPKKDAL